MISKISCKYLIALLLFFLVGWFIAIASDTGYILCGDLMTCSPITSASDGNETTYAGISGSSNITIEADITDAVGSGNITELNWYSRICYIMDRYPTYFEIYNYNNDTWEILDTWSNTGGACNGNLCSCSSTPSGVVKTGSITTDASNYTNNSVVRYRARSFALNILIPLELMGIYQYFFVVKSLKWDV